ncbi:MAG: twin-arginine translocase subunit TatC [Paludibacteraceae bacterium]|nr:twin-arginine translocase subunit TatC [Paludibacteraceae bacterium]MBQ9705771.1 twin-arginine translocase subunit TatC [Paludibacteraceae bacterium]
MTQNTDDKNLPLTAHLDELRKVLLRCLAAWAAGFVLCFCLRDQLFGLLFAPTQTDFVLYRALCRLAEWTGWASLCPPPFEARFISTELTAQFMTHVQVALWSGLVLAAPWLLVQLYGFIAPALYQRERRYSVGLVAASLMLFLAGVLLNYFLIFPFSFRFLVTYQVLPDVTNQITLASYVSSFLVLSLLMGVLFCLPVAAWFLARMDLVSARQMRRYRRHAVVAVLVVAAVITPTGDAFTLLLVSLPVYLLYELSILVVRFTAPEAS